MDESQRANLSSQTRKLTYDHPDSGMPGWDWRPLFALLPLPGVPGDDLMAESMERFRPSSTDDGNEDSVFD
jgi:hypothetical protein